MMTWGQLGVCGVAWQLHPRCSRADWRPRDEQMTRAEWNAEFGKIIEVEQ